MRSQEEIDAARLEVERVLASCTEAEKREAAQQLLDQVRIYTLFVIQLMGGVNTPLGLELHKLYDRADSLLHKVHYFRQHLGEVGPEVSP